MDGEGRQECGGPATYFGLVQGGTGCAWKQHVHSRDHTKVKSVSQVLIHHKEVNYIGIFKTNTLFSMHTIHRTVPFPK